MGSNINFKNFGNDPPGDGGRPPRNFPLTRQSSIYSLTFEEFQNAVGGSGKDFGSTNMDELLKNIRSAEENQNLGSASVQEGFGGYLLRQGSLTLPRTLSQKTVDEVWRDMSNDESGGGAASGVSMPQRQKTLGEITLEEFLVKAGVRGASGVSMQQRQTTLGEITLEEFLVKAGVRGAGGVSMPQRQTTFGEITLARADAQLVGRANKCN